MKCCTGVEAVSTRRDALEDPSSGQAGITLIWKAFVRGEKVMSISFVGREIGEVRSEAEAVVSSGGGR